MTSTPRHDPKRDDLHWRTEHESITESDHFLRDVVANAELPPLLAALAAATRNPALLREDLRPELTPVDTVGHPHGGMSPETQERAREVAFEALRRLRDEAITSVDTLPSDEVEHLLGYLTRGTTKWYDSLKHELDLAPDKNGAPDWSFADVAGERPFEVLIVGSGVAGVAAAHRYRQAGVPFTQIESADRMAGTWAKNRYPGVRLDTPTFAYSYSFAQRADWPHQFAQGAEIEEYLVDVAQRAGILDDIEFGTRLLSARWDEEDGVWVTVTRTADGERTRRFNAVVSGVGQLDLPNIPDVPGAETFRGVTMHSQEWDPSYDWSGKRVAVVGTGASAYQIVPAMHRDVASLTVFQRSAPWMLPAPAYHDSMSEAFAWLVRKVPHFGQWFRLWTMVLGTPGRFHTVRAEEGWEGAPLSVSPTNQKVREELIGRLREQFEGREDLFKIAVPHYPPGAKRMLRDNGVWAEALRAEHTAVSTSPIAALTETGILTEDGTHHEVDLIVWATGFKPSDYLDGVEVVGRDGITVHEYWKGDARAHNGVTVPGFPNFFMLYGPNVGGVVAGSLHFMIERAVEYSLKAVREVLTREVKAIDVTPEALDEFLAWVDAENRQMAWGQPYVRTWYQNKDGRVSQVWPFTNAEYWEITERIDPDEHEFLD
ncbi:flavin-containing monooxygenase [Nocardioides gilvus]|uniref:flavin-containing monooxygenase n=1 Tax=Nocardioides gilvus TaxID=1735589 RepID=UPI000D74C51F|nr:NAD(P)/FAD-dependent oxidoreductase [Nocardioides gilvus]